jgi:hypothetical protein
MIMNLRIVIAALLIAGCGSDPSNSAPGSSSGNTTINQSLGIAQTSSKGLVIGLAPVGSTTKQALFTINTNFSLSRVYVTSDESTNANLRPTGIFSTPNFVVAKYEGGGGVLKNGVTCNLVLIRKTDGKLFCVNAELDSSGSGSVSGNSADPSTDSLGNIYVKATYNQSSGPALIKISIDGSDNLTVTTLLDGNSGGDGSVYTFAVNLDGDVIATTIENSIRKLKLVSNGVKQEIETAYVGEFVSSSFDATSKSLFWSSVTDIKKIDKSGATFGSPTIHTTATTNPNIIVKSSDKVYVAATNGTTLTEQLNAGGTTTARTITAASGIVSAIGYPAGVMLRVNSAGPSTKIIRFRSSDNNQSTYVDQVTEGYQQINSLGVTSSGEALFFARKYDATLGDQSLFVKVAANGLTKSETNVTSSTTSVISILSFE